MTRLLLAIMISLLPGLAAAQDASSLGPQGATGGASTQTLNLLQPASPATLQSADSGAGGVSQPTTEQSLQQTQGSDQVKILLDQESGGSNGLPPAEDEEKMPTYWVLIFPAIIALTLWLRKRTQRKA